jgi:hypothetical protein
LIFMLMQKCLMLMLTHLQQAFDVDAFADCLLNINQILKAMICGIGEDDGRDCIWNIIQILDAMICGTGEGGRRVRMLFVYLAF